MSKLTANLNKPAESMSWFEAWSIFFNFANDPAQRGLINNLIKTKEEINMASELLMEISKDERERAHLRSRKMFETDRISNLLTAEARGEARGEALGEMRKALEIANAMIDEGYNENTIARVTGLSVDDILRLIREHRG